jgi:hypothetical protein
MSCFSCSQFRGPPTSSAKVTTCAAIVMSASAPPTILIPIYKGCLRFIRFCSYCFCVCVRVRALSRQLPAGRIRGLGCIGSIRINPQSYYRSDLCRRRRINPTSCLICFKPRDAPAPRTQLLTISQFSFVSSEPLIDALSASKWRKASVWDSMLLKE